MTYAACFNSSSNRRKSSRPASRPRGGDQRSTRVAPATSDAQRGILLSSQRGMFIERPMADTDVCDLVLRQFGI